MAYHLGESARYTKQFTTVAGTLTDPTTVNVYLKRPDGFTAKYVYNTHAVVVRSSAGVFYFDVVGQIPGVYVVRWEGIGNSADDGEERTFLFESSEASDAQNASRSLGTSYSEIQRAVGRVLGFGRDPNLWQSNERLDADDVIRSGYRRFIWHPPLTTSSLVGQSGEIKKLKQETPHTWSFLKPTKSLPLAADTHTYDLPDDFGEMVDGSIILSTDQQPIALVPDEEIRKLQSTAARSGVPKYASISVLDGRATKYQVTFYPTPDIEYTANVTYDIAPNDLSDQQPIPLGGPMHAETIIEACLAAAEKYLNDTEGLHEKKFLECLARSIVADQNLLATHEDDVWPLEDKAKGLAVNKAYLKRLIGMALEYGPNPATWNHAQGSRVDLALETGLRKFYVPMVLPGERFSWEWKFLKPIGTVTTNSVVYTYDLPSGFVSFEGPITFAPGEGTLYPGLEIVPEGRIRQWLANSTGTGRPQYAATRTKAMDKAAGGTTWEVQFYPPPDDEYELSFQYNVNPLALSEETSLPYGGQVHAQTLIEACLTAAEEMMNVVNGPHAGKFIENLRTSVSLDRKAGCPESVGINRDRSDRPMDEWEYTWHDMNGSPVRYGGVLY